MVNIAIVEIRPENGDSDLDRHNSYIVVRRFLPCTLLCTGNDEYKMMFKE